MTYTTTDVIRVAGGKLAERWAVDDRLGMMQQLGVVPSAEQARPKNNLRNTQINGTEPREP